MDNTFSEKKMKQEQMTRLKAYKERIGELCERLEDVTDDLNELYDDVSEETAKQTFVKTQSVGAQKKVTQIAEELREKGVPGFDPKKDKNAESDFQSLLNKIRNMEKENSPAVTYCLIVNDGLVIPVDVFTEEDDDEH